MTSVEAETGTKESTLRSHYVGRVNEQTAKEFFDEINVDALTAGRDFLTKRQIREKEKSKKLKKTTKLLKKYTKENNQGIDTNPFKLKSG
jgi:hypothetical protein